MRLILLACLLLDSGKSVPKSGQMDSILILYKFNTNKVMCNVKRKIINEQIIIEKIKMKTKTAA